MVENLHISECQGFGLATVMRRGRTGPESEGHAYPVAMPSGPHCATLGDAAHGDVTLIGTGPGTWLAFAPQRPASWHQNLSALLRGMSVSDQSGGYVIFRIAGPDARAFLQRGAYIDLDGPTFGAGAAATTVIAHIGVVIWQPDDSNMFYVALFRSFAESFHEWLRMTSATFNI